MEYARKRLKTLHVIMLSTLAVVVVVSLVYFSHGAGPIYQASDVLGQYDPPVTTYPPSYTQGDPWNGEGLLSDHGMSNPTYAVVDTDDKILFVSDTDGNRVLGYQLDDNGAFVGTTATYVLGQPNMETGTAGGGQFGLSGPTGLSYDFLYHQLAVADTNNNRIVVFNFQSGLYSGMGADYIIGQPDFDTTDPGLSDHQLDHPMGVDFSYSMLLFVADTNNNRVLAFDSVSGAGGMNGQSAYFVIGQATMNAKVTGTAINRLNGPVSVKTNNGADILVADTNNNRVMIFTPAGADDPDATHVIGQATFATATAGSSGAELDHPTDADLDMDLKIMYVADKNNNRVLVYDLPGGVVSDGMSAAYVIGQTDLNSHVAATSQNELSAPIGVAINDSIGIVPSGFGNVSAAIKKVWVVDAGNNRATEYSFSAPSDLYHVAAEGVIGQRTTEVTPMGTTPVFTLDNTFSGGGAVPNDRSFYDVGDTVVDTTNHRLFIADKYRNRILIFNLDSNNNLIDRIADNVLGQPDFTDFSAAVASQSHFAYLTTMTYDSDDDILFVGDRYRVVAFDVRPPGSSPKDLCGVTSTGLSDGMDASCVFGQPDFSTDANALLVPDIQRVYDTDTIAYDSISKRLFVGGGSNSSGKILVFDLSAGIQNNPERVVMFGSLINATDMVFDNVHNRLFIADSRHQDETSTYGSIVWVYDTSSTIDSHFNPTNVLGTTHVDLNGGDTISDTLADADQCSTMTGFLTYDEHWTASTICDIANAIDYDSVNDRLYVSQRGFNNATRITIYDTSSITDGENAVAVLGQGDFTSSDAGGVTQSTSASSASGIGIDGTNNRVYVAESNRVLVYDFITPVSTTLSNATKGAGYGPVTIATQNEQGTPSLVSPALPTGITLSGTDLGGTPTTLGTHSFIVQAIDTFGASLFSGNRRYSLTVVSPSGGGGPMPQCTDTHANNYMEQNSCEYDPPQVTIVTPAATGGSYTSSTSSVVVSGTATDNDTLTSVEYTLNGGSISATTGLSSWSTPALALQTGSNTVVITAKNNHDLTASATITIIYNPVVPVETCATNPSLPGCTITVIPPITPPGGGGGGGGGGTIIPPATIVPPTPVPTCATDPTMPGCSPVEKVSRFASVMSRLGAILGVIAGIFVGTVALSELAFLPQRLWQLLLGALGFKKRLRRWGTVYDSITKQPLDPVYVTLLNTKGKEVASSITDIDGRYGFLVPAGTYHIVVNKTSYIFPSRKLAGRDHDELYNDLYFGEDFVVREGQDVFTKNIPMDPELFNWNEYIKHEQKLTKWNARKDKVLNRIINAIFAIGFISAVVAAIIHATLFNIIIVGVYVILLVIRELGIRLYSSGSVKTKSGNPIAFGIVRIYSAKLDKLLFSRPLDKYGRYYALVPKGDYRVKIEKKNDDQSYTEIYESKPFTAKRGVINRTFVV